MMTNLYRHNNRGPARRMILATILVVVLFLFDRVSGGILHKEAQRIAGGISYTSIRIFDAVRLSGIFSTRARLAAQNDALQTQIVQYQEQAAAYKALQEENALLAGLTHLAQDKVGQTAPIISWLRASP